MSNILCDLDDWPSRHRRVLLIEAGCQSQTVLTSMHEGGSKAGFFLIEDALNSILEWISQCFSSLYPLTYSPEWCD